MKHEDIYVGEEVAYIPHHLLMGDTTKMVKEENLGVVTSKNDLYVFVRYKDKEGSQATRAEDLYTLRYREDLRNLLNNFQNPEVSDTTGDAILTNAGNQKSIKEEGQ